MLVWQAGGLVMSETGKLAATLVAEFGAVCVATLALASALLGSAEAHDRDCHGMPVSEAKKLGCCGAGTRISAKRGNSTRIKTGFGTILSPARTSASSAGYRTT